MGAMNQYVSLNAWIGGDKDRAAARLATLFALPQKEAGKIVKQLSKGKPWQFAEPLDAKNAGNVNRYLTSQGFSVELIPISSAPGSSGAPADSGLQPPAQGGRAQEEEFQTFTEDEFLFDDGGVTQEEAGRMLEEAFDEAPPDESVDAASVPRGPGKEYRVGFRGEGGELFRIMCVNWILTVLTLGIYTFWAKTKVRKYLLEQTSFARDYFGYHGTGRELFRGALFFSLILIVLGAASAGLQMVLGPGSREIVEPVAGLLVLLLIPALMVGAYRYRLTRTSLRNIRFSFRGSRAEAMGHYFAGYLLTLLTLGLYYPFLLARLKRFWVGNTRFGNQAFEYSGEGKDLFGKFLVFILLLIPTGGLNIPWWQAFLSRYNWGHTHFYGGTFRFTASGWDMFKLQFGNLLLIVFTLGIAYPWVICRRQKFLAGHLSFEGNIDMNRVIQDMQKGGALSEGGVDMLDIPLDFG